MIFIELLAGLVQVLYIVALVAGAVICVRQKFMAGIYFFLILFVVDISKYVYTPAIEHWIENGRRLVGGLTVGETAVVISIIINLLKVAAFFILVIGLYRRWRSSSTHTQA